LVVGLGTTVYGKDASALLRGTVRDASSGKPLGAAIISLTRDGTSTATKRTGEFEFNAAPGWWPTRLQVQATGYLTYTGDKIRLGEGDTLTFNIELQKEVNPLVVSCDTCPPPGVVVGRVVDRTTDRPLAGATVSIHSTNKKQRTSEDGAFSFPDIAGGEHVLHVEHSEYHSLRETVMVSDGTVTNPTISMEPLLTIEDTTGTVLGRITDADSGTGIENAEVSLLNTTYATMADSTGDYLLPLIPPGTYSLLATKWGYDAQVADNITVRAKEETRKSLALEPRATGTAALRGTVGALSGTVLDEQGDPVESVGLLLSETGDFTRSSVMGQFRFDSIPGGVYSVLAVDEEYDTLRSREVDVWNGEETRIEIRLRKPKEAGVGDGIVLSEGRGAIVGLVVDAQKGTEIAGVQVRLGNGDEKAVGGLDGRYVLADLKPGVYTVVADHTGYSRRSISDVRVSAGERTELDILLSASDVTEMQRMSIRAPAPTGSGAVLLKERQNQLSFTDAIGAQEMSRTGASNAAEAMKTVTGATVVDDKYVVVRGLPVRYTTTMLNGASLPSPDPDNKAVNMDLFPAGVIENIIVHKTFVPRLPGDWAGGVVDIRMKDLPDQPTLVLGSSQGYDPQVTFRDDFLSYRGGSLDWLAVDDGTREIPDEIGKYTKSELDSRFRSFFVGIDKRRLDDSEDNYSDTLRMLDKMINSLNHQMTPSKATALQNQSYSLSGGRRFSLGERALGIQGAFTYSNKYSHVDEGVKREFSGSFTKWSDNEWPTPDKDLEVTKSKHTVQLGLHTSAAARLSNEHEISVDYLWVQNAIDEASRREGYYAYFLNDTNGVFRTYQMHYTERSLHYVRPAGEHVIRFGFLPLTVTWIGSFARGTQKEPDLRDLAYQFSSSGGRNYYEIHSNFDEPSHKYRNLRDISISGGGDISIPFYQWFGDSSTIVAGGGYWAKLRERRQRKIEYQASNFLKNTDPFVPPEELIVEENMGLMEDSVDGMNWGVFFVDNSPEDGDVDGRYRIAHAFGMFELPIIHTLVLTGGLRVERVDMYVASIHPKYIGQTEAELDNVDFLPSAALSFGIAENMTFRSAYGKTVIRPTLREKSPFITAGYIGGPSYFGNPDLISSRVHNFDLRWEWYPRAGELLSIGSFYKIILDPIEKMYPTQNNVIKSVNTGRPAQIWGIEFEARKRFAEDLPVLKDFSVSGNLTLVKSRVELTEESRKSESYFPDEPAHRPFQGQSPYVINLLLSYDNEKYGVNANTAFNIFGERLAELTRNIVPWLWETPEPLLNVTASKTLGSRWKLKFSAKDLLPIESKLVHHYRGEEIVVEEVEDSPTFSLGLEYSF